MRTASAIALWFALAGAAVSDCRQALVLALDVSGSVDAAEYRLQLSGVALALTDPVVTAALLSIPDAPVALAVFEWSGREYQRDILSWTLLDSAAAIGAVAARLDGWQRSPAPQSTGIGAALVHAERVLARAPSCWRHTVDVSGDGRNNDWPEPRLVYSRGTLADATVNALVIGQDAARHDDDRSVGVAELVAYFRANVLHGPDAFTEVALGYDDYAEAMKRKLLRELETLPVGQASGTEPVRLAADQ